MNYLPANIRLLRKKKGINQAQLALNFGKRQNTVGNWENGISEPSIKELVSLSQIFMVSIEDLVKKDLGLQQEADSNLPESPGGMRPKPVQTTVPETEKQTEGFWLILRELRRLNDIIDRLRIELTASRRP